MELLGQVGVAMTLYIVNLYIDINIYETLKELKENGNVIYYYISIKIQGKKEIQKLINKDFNRQGFLFLSTDRFFFHH